MLLPVLGLYNVHVVRRCGHDLGQRAEQRLAVVDRKTQKIGDEQTALRQLRVRMVSTPFSLIRSEFVTNIVPRRPLFCNQPPVKPLFRNVPSCPMREKAVY